MVSKQLWLRRIFHPSDFTDASEAAFVHALKLAVAGQGRLTILHTELDSNDSHWSEFPAVRRSLEQWGLLPPESSREDVLRLGLNVDKIAARRRDPVASILRYLEQHPHDLIVLATYQYEGLERLLHKAVAEPVARRAGELTLFVPFGVEGFVAEADGALSLFNVLVPVDHRPRPQLAVDAAASVAALLGASEVTFTLLHVGSEEDFPTVQLPERRGWEWLKSVRYGNVEEQILHVAADTDADLIVMATEGHHGFMDALRGSTTERIVRAANCPVLAVPMGLTDGENLSEARVWQPAT